MNRDFFINKLHCELGIVSQEINPSVISDKLNIIPDYSYCKGDFFQSKQSGRSGKRFQNLWTVKSKQTVIEDENIEPHLVYFQNLLKDKLIDIHELKNNPNCVVNFWIWIETENAGFGLDLSTEDLQFISSISNRVHISFLANQKIEEDEN